MKFRFFLVALTATLLFSQAVRGQSALNGFNPNANDYVDVIVVQPDGKILIGGAFTSVSPNGGPAVTRNRIARLNPDGTLDTAFNPNSDNPIITIALQADGKILVGGSFTNIGGQPRNCIARLDATTGAADSFDPTLSAGGSLPSVQSIAVQADGKILVGGFFFSLGGQLRNHIARLDPNGVADSFDPNLDSFILTMKVQANGQILIGGGFTTLTPNGGPTVTRNRIARLNSNGTVDGGFDPNANDSVYAIAVQADGSILAGGFFQTIGGQSRNNIARLNASTGLADSFDPNANSAVKSIAVQADGKILVGGNFTNVHAQFRSHIARLDPVTGLPDSFDPSADTNILAIALQPDGKILVGGQFIEFIPNGGTSVIRNAIARLEIDGRVERTINLNIVGSSVLATALQRDGKILIGGSFSSVLGTGRNNIARVSSEGTLDTTFNPNANGTVNCIAVQADGKILVGGSFNGANSIAGQTRNRIARLNADGSLDTTFNPSSSDPIHAIAVQTDGKVLVGGEFIAFFGAITVGGQSRTGIARLDATTGAADSFNPDPAGQVFSITVQPDGKIVAGGNFTTMGGQPRNRIARVDTNGVADSFDPNASDIVYAIAVQADGKILAGGQFNNIGGQPRNRLARLDATLGAADSFDPNATPVNSVVYAIAVQADGKILGSGTFSNIGGQPRNNIARLDATGAADSFDPNATGNVASIAQQADGTILTGGQFTNIGGQPRNLFACLTNDTAASQTIAVTQSTVKWTRGGSSPQFTRVTFESSNDNVSYTDLGNGTAVDSNWTLTGLSLPIGQNIYIRARGYYRTGYQNGSESIVEFVARTFITQPVAVSRKMQGGTDFDIDLPLTGTAGVECRNGGATNDFTIVTTLSGNVTVMGNPQAQVTSGTGTVGSGGVSNGGTVTVNGNTVTIPLTNVANAQTIAVTLFNVSDGTNTNDITVPVSLLTGDTNSDRFVDAIDVSQVKSKSGQILDASNFREDINLDGFLDSIDTAFVKSKAGTALPGTIASPSDQPAQTTPKQLPRKRPPSTTGRK